MGTYTEEQKRQVIEMYEEGMSSYKISSITGISKSTVQRWAFESGIKKRGSKKDIESRKKLIKEMYTSGKTSKEIALEIGETEGAVAFHVREMGISRDRGVQPNIDEHCFDIIDTEEKAYWLGYLMADGNVSVYNNQYSLKLHTQYGDKEIIDKFINFIKTENKPLYKEKENSYYLSVSSKHMITRLVELGVKPNKSGDEILPEQLREDLVRHFIRGYFDGDGITCIGKSKRSGFVGGKKIIESIHQKTSATQKIQPQGKVFYYLGGVKYSKSLYEYMYNNASIWLERKKERMRIICDNTEITK